MVKVVKRETILALFINGLFVKKMRIMA